MLLFGAGWPAFGKPCGIFSCGMLFRFEPEERHSVSSAEGARILLFLAPWPGAGHYRGDNGG